MEKYHSIYFISVKLDYEQPFCSDFQPFLKSDVSLARKSNEVLIFRSNDIKKVGLFHVSDDEFISLISSIFINSIINGKKN